MENIKNITVLYVKKNSLLVFLVTAHIKKRAYCSLDEMLDIKNIVMSMCKFGCNDLFEKGYISIKSGVVVKNSNLPSTPYIKHYIDTLINNTIDEWNNDSKKYFEWHLNFHKF